MYISLMVNKCGIKEMLTLNSRPNFSLCVMCEVRLVDEILRFVCSKEVIEHFPVVLCILSKIVPTCESPCDHSNDDKSYFYDTFLWCYLFEGTQRAKLLKALESHVYVGLCFFG